MYKIFQLFFLFIFVASCSNKVKNGIKGPNQEYLVPIKVGPKYGYVDQDDNIVIPAKFEMALPFFKDKAIVKDGLMDVLIDKKGNYIIPPKKMTRLQWTGNHKTRKDKGEVLCSDYIIEKTHAVKFVSIFDLNGNEILKDRFTDCHAGAKGQFIVRNENYEKGVVDLSGKTIIPCKKGVEIKFYEDIENGIYILSDKESNNCTYYDVNGKLMSDQNPCNSAKPKSNPLTFEVPEKFKNEQITHRSLLKNGMKRFLINRQGYRSYIIDDKGELICENCRDVLDCNKYYVKSIRDESASGTLQNISDFEGNTLFSENYYKITPIDGDDQTCPTRFIVSKSNRAPEYFIADESGNALSAVYKIIDNYKVKTSGFHIATSLDDKKAIIDNNGKVLHNQNYLEQHLPVFEKRAFKKVGNLLASVRKSTDPFADIIYLSPNGVPQYLPFPERDPKDIKEGDYVHVKDKNEIQKISGIYNGKPSVQYINRSTYEEHIIVYEPEELSLLFVDHKKNKYLKIYDYDTKEYILDLKQLDQVHLKRDKGNVEGYIRELSLKIIDVQPKVGVSRQCAFKDVLKRITYLSSKEE